MTTLSSIVNLRDLAQAIDDGYVRERVHPDDPTLRILNYTEKAQYERVWTPVTRACRGLIVREDSVLARPWAKFFNYGEHPAGSLDLTAPVEVTDKLDGSLGILYWAPDGDLAIATRGSFTSEQALHATALLREKYTYWQPGDPWATYLFEIVYPGNRIVVDYGATDDLLFLGAVDLNTGRHTQGPADEVSWPGPRTTQYDTATLADALALEPRPNAEGIVVRFVDTDLRVKIKQDDYVALHRLVTGLSEKTVWEHLAANDGTYTGLLAAIPDEFHDWVHDHAKPLLREHGALLADAQAAHEEIIATLGHEFERRDYAQIARERADRSLLFMLLDGRDPSPAIWKQLRPYGPRPMLATSEDIA